MPRSPERREYHSKGMAAPRTISGMTARIRRASIEMAGGADADVIAVHGATMYSSSNPQCRSSPAAKRGVGLNHPVTADSCGEPPIVISLKLVMRGSRRCSFVSSAYERAI